MHTRNILPILWLLLVLLAFPGCSSPPLPEGLKLIEKQDYNLWKAEASIYLVEEYSLYKIRLRKTKDELIKEQAGLPWFRNYGDIESEFKEILRDGEDLLKRAQEKREAKKNDISNQIFELNEKIKDLDKLTRTINEGRFARRSLTKGELMLKEATLSFDKGDYDKALENLDSAASHINSTEEVLSPYLKHYTSKNLIKRWKGWAEDTIAESRKMGFAVIVVNKMDRNLIIYKKGWPFRRYKIGLGKNGSLDKLHEGDGATPEGRYKVIRKLAKSKYHKALLLNYPNDEDKREFIIAKKNRQIPARAAIGGLIEIHGGGKDGMTDGCISLDNKDVDEIFDMISVGTLVTIVGNTTLTKEIIPGANKVEG